MNEYKVYITKTSVIEMILKAEDKEELTDIINEGIKTKSFDFDSKKPEYLIETSKID